MKIINRTHWRTDHLRAIAARVARNELDPQKRRHVVLTFEYARGWSAGSSGHATIGGTHATVRLISGNPRTTRFGTPLGPREPDKIDLAGVLAHEMAHLRGMGHDRMRNAPRYRRVGNHRDIYRWAADYPLERKPDTLPITPEEKIVRLDERRQKRQARLDELAALWARRQRFATKKAAKYAREARNYRTRQQLKDAATHTPTPDADPKETPHDG